MASFLYFKPGTTQTVTKKLVKEWGLDYAFTSSPNGTVCQGDTPTGTTGVVFGDTNRLGDWQPIMKMAEQEWAKSGDGDWYVGYWKAAPPTPADLARPNQLPGYAVKIGGHEWTIPLTAKFDSDSKSLITNLPCALKYSGNGSWKKGAIREIHRRLWEIGQPFRDDFIARFVHEQPARDFSDDEIGQAIAAHLHANYVVSGDELSIMEVITSGDSGVGAAIMVANDMLTIMAWAEQQKKTGDPATADGSSTSSGEAA